VKNSETAFGFTVFLGVLHFWIMPLFFFVSGASSSYAFQSRTPGQYAGERFRRLGFPYVFGVLVIGLPHNYFHCLDTSQECLGLLAGWWRDLLLIRPRFSPDVLGPGSVHLWFLSHLLVMSLLATPLFLHLQAGGARRSMGGSWVTGRAGLLVLGVSLVAVRVALTPLLPGYTGWADFFFWYLFFVYGYRFIHDPGLADAAARLWGIALAIGVAGFLGIMVLETTIELKPCFGFPDYSPGCMLFLALSAVVAWSMVVAFFGVSRIRLSFRNRFLGYAAPMVISFYVVHHLVIVVTGFHVIRLEMGTTSKFILVGLTALLASLVLCETIKRVPLLRLLMGTGRGRMGLDR
jgi:surface polysaccharide O-acyltransferase-like enzyme